MASKTRITVVHDKEATADLKSQYQAQSYHPRLECNNLINLLEGLATGARNLGSLAVTIDDGDEVSASGTVTFSSIADGDTVTVAGVVFTAKASGASGNAQFNIGASDSTAATAFAAKVNAHPSLTNVASAAATNAVTTITAAVSGPIGNLVSLAISAHGSVSGANLTSGAAAANSTTVTYTK